MKVSPSKHESNSWKAPLLPLIPDMNAEQVVQHPVLLSDSPFVTQWLGLQHSLYSFMNPEQASGWYYVTTKSHAAIQLSRRPLFKPVAMYSDTWPAKSDYWPLLFGENLHGWLGLFHFLQRILQTLRKRHVDYFVALNALLNAVYVYNPEDYENLLRALKDGTLSSKGKKLTNDDIAELQDSKLFRKRYSKYLHKEIRPPPNALIQNLDDWFCRFKCTASDNSRPALGCLDPNTCETLFSPETRDTVANCEAKVN